MIVQVSQRRDSHQHQRPGAPVVADSAGKRRNGPGIADLAQQGDRAGRAGDVWAFQLAQQWADSGRAGVDERAPDLLVDRRRAEGADQRGDGGRVGDSAKRARGVSGRFVRRPAPHQRGQEGDGRRRPRPAHRVHRRHLQVGRIGSGHAQERGHHPRIPQRAQRPQRGDAHHPIRVIQSLEQQRRGRRRGRGIQARRPRDQTDGANADLPIQVVEASQITASEAEARPGQAASRRPRASSAWARVCASGSRAACSKAARTSGAASPRRASNDSASSPNVRSPGVEEGPVNQVSACCRAIGSPARTSTRATSRRA